MNLDQPRRLLVGDSIEVHTRFNDSWSAGFEIAEVLTSGYRVRRTHDHAMLPEMTGDDDVRAARKPSPWIRPTH
jgi:hypothetical protein